jgi:hypothetical protein
VVVGMMRSSRRSLFSDAHAVSRAYYNCRVAIDRRGEASPFRPGGGHP